MARVHTSACCGTTLLNSSASSMRLGTAALGSMLIMVTTATCGKACTHPAGLMLCCAIHAVQASSLVRALQPVLTHQSTQAKTEQGLAAAQRRT